MTQVKYLQIPTTDKRRCVSVSTVTFLRCLGFWDLQNGERHCFPCTCVSSHSSWNHETAEQQFCTCDCWSFRACHWLIGWLFWWLRFLMILEDWHCIKIIFKDDQGGFRKHSKSSASRTTLDYGQEVKQIRLYNLYLLLQYVGGTPGRFKTNSSILQLCHLCTTPTFL